VEERMLRHFAAIEYNQRENGTPEVVRNYARQQFEKRLARIARAREQTLEQVYQGDAGDEETESGAA
jgi:hypothetical protein